MSTRIRGKNSDALRELFKLIFAFVREENANGTFFFLSTCLSFKPQGPSSRAREDYRRRRRRPRPRRFIDFMLIGRCNLTAAAPAAIQPTFIIARASISSMPPRWFYPAREKER